jgi:hypothetical protein
MIEELSNMPDFKINKIRTTYKNKVDKLEEKILEIQIEKNLYESLIDEMDEVLKEYDRINYTDNYREHD